MQFSSEILTSPLLKHIVDCDKRKEAIKIFKYIHQFTGVITHSKQDIIQLLK